MVFLSICTALYDYVPQSDGELPIREGELVYILEKSTEDEWWKAKKKAPGAEEEEPVGLIPNNYVEEVRGIYIPCVEHIEHDRNPVFFLPDYHAQIHVWVVSMTDGCFNCRPNLFIAQRPCTTTHGKLMRSYPSLKTRRYLFMTRRTLIGLW